jgi:chromosome segregation ATPase
MPGMPPSLKLGVGIGVPDATLNITCSLCPAKDAELAALREQVADLTSSIDVYRQEAAHLTAQLTRCHEEFKRYLSMTPEAALAHFASMPEIVEAAQGTAREEIAALNAQLEAAALREKALREAIEWFGGWLDRWATHMPKDTSEVYGAWDDKRSPKEVMYALKAGRE